MPGKERNAKSATKALAEVVAKPGQAKITSLFTSATKKTSHGSEQDKVNVNPASVLLKMLLKTLKILINRE